MESEDQICLRAMTADDVRKTAEIESECFSDAWSEKLLNQTFESPYDETWVLEGPEGELYGYINLRFLAGEGELMRIGIKKDCRGRGYSRKLMDRMVKSAEEKEAWDLTLEVRAGNETAINLYESYGFKKEAVRRGYYHEPTEDAFIMWRRRMPGTPT